MQPPASGTKASSCTCTWSPSPSCPGPLASSWTCRPAPWYSHGPHTLRPPSCRQCQVPPRLVDVDGSLPKRSNITNSGLSSNELMTSVIFCYPAVRMHTFKLLPICLLDSIYMKSFGLLVYYRAFTIHALPSDFIRSHVLRLNK